MVKGVQQGPVLVGTFFKTVCLLLPEGFIVISTLRLCLSCCLLLV